MSEQLERKRPTTLTGMVASKPSLVTRAYVAPEELAGAPAPMQAPSAQTPAPAAQKLPQPYKQPPRVALWLILALVMAIIAALVWWLAS